MINQTTYAFKLPIGLLDSRGMLHQEGLIRLTTGFDEINLYQDPRIADLPVYGLLIRFSQVILRLGNLSQLNPVLLEGLFLADFYYLQEFYNLINPPEGALLASKEKLATPQLNYIGR